MQIDEQEIMFVDNSFAVDFVKRLFWHFPSQLGRDLLEFLFVVDEFVVQEPLQVAFGIPFKLSNPGSGSLVR